MIGFCQVACLFDISSSKHITCSPANGPAALLPLEHGLRGLALPRRKAPLRTCLFTGPITNGDVLRLWYQSASNPPAPWTLVLLKVNNLPPQLAIAWFSGSRKKNLPRVKASHVSQHPALRLISIPSPKNNCFLPIPLCITNTVDQLLLPVHDHEEPS